MPLGHYLSRLRSCWRLQADQAGPPRVGALLSDPITWPLEAQPLPGTPSCSKPKLQGRVCVCEGAGTGWDSDRSGQPTGSQILVHS